MPDVSIIVVNWNSCRFLERCLASLHAHRPLRHSMDVHVVDNASFDGSHELVGSRFPDVRFVQGSTNIGFGRANNVAAREAQGRLLLFLNPDTEVVRGTLDGLIAFFDRTPDAGVVGVRLLNDDGSLQETCVQQFPTLLNQVFDAKLARRWFPNAPLWGDGARFGIDADRPVEAVSGACLMMRRDVFTSVGGFTENYFMYAEDVDLCAKVRQLGLRNYAVGTVTVMHHGGGSSKSSANEQFGNLVMRESLATYFELRHGRLHAWLYRLLMGVSAVGRLVILSPTCLHPVAARRSAFRGAVRKWTSVLRWSLGAERWVKTLGNP